MNKENIILDSGYDFNNDDHCDLDGWFVDKYGDHRPVLRRVNREPFKNILDPAFNYVSSDEFFTAYGEMSGISLSPLYEYSLNDDNRLLSSPNINLYLRNGYMLSDNLRKRIRELDYLINHFTIKKSLHVYRGIDIDVSKPYSRNILNLSRGDIYFDKGYTSTTHAMEVALKYGQQNKGNTMVIMDIELNVGVHAIPLFTYNGSAGKGNEYEILLNRQQKMKVINKKETIDGSKRIIYLKMETM